MLQRLRVLQQASLTGAPCRLLPSLYLSGAVEASSLHVLRHLGITHILNATEVRRLCCCGCCSAAGAVLGRLWGDCC